MAYRSRRRRPAMNRRGNGRQRMWIQSTLGNISLVEPSTGTYSGILVEPADWEREVSAFTKIPKRRGAPRLEGMYLDVASNFLLGGSGSQFARLLNEVMVYTYSNQFANPITSSSSYDQTFEGQRVLLYDATSMSRQSHRYMNNDDTDPSWQYSENRWQIKSKVNLAEVRVGIALRVATDVNPFAEASVQVAFRAYVSLP